MKDLLEIREYGSRGHSLGFTDYRLSATIKPKREPQTHGPVIVKVRDGEALAVPDVIPVLPMVEFP